MRRIKMNKESVVLRFIVTMVIAAVGGFVFNVLHIPMPWLLGPLTGVVLGTKFLPIELYWPVALRDISMIIIGYTIGLSFTRTALTQIYEQLPSIVLMTILLLLLCALIALLISKMSGIDYPTILTGSIPGGLSQMVTLAEEMKTIDLSVVMYLQISRVMMIIFLVPFFVFHPLLGADQAGSHTEFIPSDFGHWNELFPNILLFAGVSVLCAFWGQKINMPTAFLVGPILGTAILNNVGVIGPMLPASVLDLSQFMIAGYIGMMMKSGSSQGKGKMLFFSIFSGSLLLIGSFGLTYILMLMHGYSFQTSYLSLAPGGMDQMGIMAHEVGADLALVVGYQLFRLFFIFFIVPPLLQMIFKRLF
ncbi:MULTISPECIES: AbrB family transcriptional regulator [unclassified Bacillus (in: firmicutes)]|uniref:AbrB family transcriptional regulator n=1 Tax=unclassified Bacillus (in: firmicutes) TaxID=185979 RepID=UPI0008F2177B|nr:MULTISPECIES: AbrB family transcriptional regulator [unclassified Bacillus (in: firmicutes)]SFB20253.1 hypothetical protein SAMN02799634_10878 [Bacillus sp. UNCCL13]SFQ90842.1 hypothetical protein SAMN04488577_3893 [Bacillus sp. cl95]